MKLVDGPNMTVVEPGVQDVDAFGVFPSLEIEQLVDAGILGLTTDADVGRRVEGLREGAEVVGRLASVCDVTAPVVLTRCRASRVMAVTTTAMLEFIGHAINYLPPL